MRLLWETCKEDGLLGKGVLKTPGVLKNSVELGWIYQFMVDNFFTQHNIKSRIGMVSVGSNICASKNRAG